MNGTMLDTNRHAFNTVNEVYDNNNLTGVGNTTLDAIKGLQTTATTQLQLLNAGLNPAANGVIISFTSSGAGTSAPQAGHIAFGDQMLTALYKIVINTWAIAGNTRQLSGGSSRDGTFAAGGWITGGIPGRDSVALASGNALGMPGEFVVRHDIAQANKSWLSDFNATGRIPVPTFRPGNDNSNSALLAEVRALRKEVEQLRKENNSGNVAIANTTQRGLAAATDEICETVEEGGKRTSYAITRAAKEKAA